MKQVSSAARAKLARIRQGSLLALGMVLLPAPGNALAADEPAAAPPEPADQSAPEAPAAEAASPESSEATPKGPENLGTVEVTGSRLSRAQMENALPVTVITRDQLVNSGVNTVADALHSSTFNSFGSYSQISGSSFSGASLVDLRGLGSNRTLVLINGHRVASAPATQGAGVDLNTIPLAVVERVEILSDGASAIYGSDAIGGVVNVILRKDYNDAEVSYSIGRPSHEGGDEESASIVGGITSEKSRLLWGASLTSKGIIFLKDRPYSRANPGDGVNFSTVNGINEAGNTIFDETFSQTLAFPASACTGTGLAPYIDDAGVDGPPGGPLCTFDFTSYAADTSALRTSSLFASFVHEMGSEWTFNADAIYAKSKSFGRFAPAPALLQLSAANPNNPYPGQIINVYHRYVALGPRDDYGDSQIFSLFGSFKGSLGIGQAEFGAAYSNNEFTNFGYNYVLNSVAAANADACPGPSCYNPFDLANPGSADTLNSMRVTINRRSLTDAREAFANYQFPLVPLPGGMIQTSVGVEARKERFFDIYDSQSEAGTVGGSAGNSSKGERTAYAIYSETVLPIIEQLELDAAFRYDNYSDVGSAFSPKGSVRYTPMKELVFRGSAGKGFRAPLLSELNANNQGDSPVARDFTTCRDAGFPDASCPEKQFDNFQVVANNNLKPEKSTQWGMGFVIQPTDWIDASFDYFNIEIKDSIATPTLQEEIIREANGQPLTPGAIINRNPPGPGQTVGTISQTAPGQVQTFNYLAIKTDGFDISINGKVALGALGSLRPSVRMSYIINSSADDGVVPPENGAGRAATNDGSAQGPKYRMQFLNEWKLSEMFGFTWDIIFIPATAETSVTDPADPLRTIPQGHIASNTRHDVQARFNAPWKGTLTVGCRDLFDRGVSPNYTLDSPYYAQTLYDPTGRIPYIGYSQKF